MVDSSTLIVSTLSELLGTYYELFCDSDTAKPCITYVEYNNYDREYGNKTVYSTVEYMIKLWALDVEDIVTYGPQIDTKMRSLGFHRTATNTLTAGRNICKCMVYSALGREEITN